MILIQGRRRLRWECLSAIPSVAPSITPPDSSLPPKSGDKLFNQPSRSSGAKPLANALPTTTSIPKYSEDDLQRILKAVLKVWAPVPVPTPAPAPAPAPIVSKVPWKKLKARSPDMYCEKFYMDFYNFCQQCENYFATAGAMGPTRILFTTSFFRDRISFRWRQYKRRHNTKTSVPVTWDKFKAFLSQSLGDSQTFVDAY